MNFQHIDPDDLALLALQFLSDQEAAQMRTHLDRCSECRANLAEIQGDLAMLALSAEPHSPPAAARDRLLAQVAREPKPRQMPQTSQTSQTITRAETPSSAPPSQERHGLQRETHSVEAPTFGVVETRASRSAAAFFLPWAGWAVAAGMTVAFGTVYFDRQHLHEQVAESSREVVSVNHQMAQLTAQTNEARRVLDTLSDPTAQRVTLTLAKQHPVPQGKATYVPGKGQLVFLANNLEPLAPLKTYELWVIPSNGQSPIPAGTFHPDEHGNASVLLPNLPTGVAAKAFGVTVEDEGGSPTPTMPILLAGAAPAAGE